MEKYDSAAIRHFIDSKKLASLGQIDNAGHLVGFAAECAIKHKISTLPANTETPHGHFPAFQTIAMKHLKGRSGFTTNMLSVLKKPVMSGWAVERRYYVTGHTTAQELESWTEDAQRILACANLKAHL